MVDSSFVRSFLACFMRVLVVLEEARAPPDMFGKSKGNKKKFSTSRPSPGFGQKSAAELCLARLSCFGMEATKPENRRGSRRKMVKPETAPYSRLHLARSSQIAMCSH